MSTKHSGLLALLHDAMIAQHERNYGLCEAKLYEALDFFHENKIPEEEKKTFVMNETDKLFKNGVIVDSKKGHRLSLSDLVGKIVSDYQRYIE